MIHVDRKDDVVLVTDTPHRATNITDATATTSRNAPESDKDNALRSIIRARRADRAMHAHMDNKCPFCDKQNVTSCDCETDSSITTRWEF